MHDVRFGWPRKGHLIYLELSRQGTYLLWRPETLEDAFSLRPQTSTKRDKIPFSVNCFFTIVVQTTQKILTPYTLLEQGYRELPFGAPWLKSCKSLCAPINEKMSDGLLACLASFCSCNLFWSIFGFLPVGLRQPAELFIRRNSSSDCVNLKVKSI